jgi:hypothetical protein
MWVYAEDEIRELLTKWRGARGQVYEYACGHGTLLVRLFRPNLSLYIACKDCRTVKFPSMGWKEANLELYQKPNPQQNDEDFKFEIKDGDRFYAACRGIGLLETEKQVLIDWPPENRKASENRVLI